MSLSLRGLSRTGLPGPGLRWSRWGALSDAEINTACLDPRGGWAEPGPAPSCEPRP